MKSTGLEGAAAGMSKTVRQAADVLEKELGATLTGVQRLDERFRQDRQVDQKAFDDVLTSLRSIAHEFVSAASNRMADLRDDDVQDLSERFTTHAQDLLDAVIDLLAVGPDIVNRLTSATAKQTTNTRTAATNRRAPKKAAPSKSAARKKTSG
ncbi:MAG: hypothetical protein ACXVLX_04540 [Ilumatobacteraceae bacterium]